jgi:hypothetical protein
VQGHSVENVVCRVWGFLRYPCSSAYLSQRESILEQGIGLIPECKSRAANSVLVRGFSQWGSGLYGLGEGMWKGVVWDEWRLQVIF